MRSLSHGKKRMIRQKKCMSILTQPEGFVLGTCVKMFSIAGPVLTFGISASVFYGVILWLMEVMG